ncbi:MAG: PhoH family protein [Rhizobiales bacterium]|nr:PhoH family protein [Hyphomicrobiales bacterium]
MVKPTRPAVDVERTISFEDNSLLSSVFGNFDQNLALMEHRLGVEISARGNHVSIRGGEGACDVTEAALVEIYNRIAAGESMSAGDIEGVIRMKDGQPSGFAKKHPTKGVGPKIGKGSSNSVRIVTRRRTISPRSKTQQDYIECLGRADLVFALGPAGTGKTYLAVVHAVSLLEQGKVDRIILSRPAVEAGESLGFLPGDMREKVDPYVRPLYDALYDVMPMDRVERDIEAGVIEIAPLAFMRGRTLSNAAIILDEAQNCTSMQMRMFLTRLGENSRMVITGDPSQTDLPSSVSKGLAEAANLLTNVESVEQITFTEADVVRHDLVARIVHAYGELDRKNQKHN